MQQTICRLLQRTVLAGAIALTLQPAHADTYDDLRTRWADKLSGNAANPADPDVALALSTQAANVQLYWDTLDTSPGRSTLWADLNTWGVESGAISDSYGRLASMAAAWRNPHSSLYGNPALAAVIVDAMDWLYANHYNETSTPYSNWYDWQIGAPKALCSLLATLYGQLSGAQLQQALATIDHFVPAPAIRLGLDGSVKATPETGANLLDKSFIVAMRGILGKSAAKVAEGRDGVSPALQYVASGDGFYADGSFIQHLNIPYQAGYGGVLLGDIASLTYLLKDSAWQINDPSLANVYDWVEASFRPFIYNGAFMDSVKGRGISRQFSDDHRSGRSLLSTLALLASGAPPQQAGRIHGLLKGWMQRDTYFGADYFSPVTTSVPGAYSMQPLFEMGLLKSVLADAGVEPVEEPVEARFFPATDRAVMRGNGYAASLSMFSKRIAAMETTNGENLRGWWTGAGMLALYNGDQTQFDGNYWATVDMLRLPGTTTDGSGSTMPTGSGKFLNTRAFVGGATLGGQFAALGMDYTMANVTGSALAGKKAWFFLGDKIVAIGAGIAGSAANIETIVDNRKLAPNGGNLLTVNGQAQPAQTGWNTAFPAAQWAHLAGDTANADIGYYFPDARTLSLARETRSGAWRDVNLEGTQDVVSNDFQSIALSHGSAPSAAGYTYVVLPGRSAAATAAFAAAPGLAVLERSSAATAVRDTALGVTGIHFWNDSAKTVNADGAAYATSNRRASVLTREQDGVLQVAVADPTQANTGSLAIEINRSAAVQLEAAPGVTVTQLSPTIKLSVDVNGAAGRTLTASFRLPRTVTLYASADSYVRDGSYADSNYGASPTLSVKNSSSGFNRVNYTQFDLSAISGTVLSAQLRMAPKTVGQASAMVNDIYLVPDNGWSESGLTWNNRPAAGAKLGAWQVPAAGAWASLEVGAAASAALAGDKRLSLRVEGAQNYGANGSVDYYAREGSATLQPQLVVTYY